MSGINTLLQTLIGTRLPTIMNASFAFVVPVLSIAREMDATYTFGFEVDAYQGSLSGFREFCMEHDQFFRIN
jgi:xanthine/uracil permease